MNCGANCGGYQSIAHPSWPLLRKSSPPPYFVFNVILTFSTGSSMSTQSIMELNFMRLSDPAVSVLEFGLLKYCLKGCLYLTARLHQYFGIQILFDFQ